MKSKSKHATQERKKDFRYTNVEFKINNSIIKIRHPAYVIIKKGNIYLYVIITHSSEIDGKLVIKLKNNPNPNDIKDSYYIAEIKIDKKDKFGKRIKGWKMNPLDDLEIRKLLEKDGSAK